MNSVAEKVDEQQRTRINRFRDPAELGCDDANMCILSNFLAAAAELLIGPLHPLFAL